MDLEVAIIGAGVIGLQVARALALSGKKDIAIFEKNIYPGEHSSSRNSGVLHAGIYYPANSLKQKLCLEGNRLWEKLAKDLDISIMRTGKFIVATDSETEDEELERLYQFVLEKRVPGIRRATSQELETLSKYVKVSSAFFSETTGVISVSEAIKALQDDLFKRDIPLLLHQPITELRKKGNDSESPGEFHFRVGEDTISAKKVINCAGLHSVEVRKMLGLNNLEARWVKGRYLKLNKKFYTDSLIYPLPKKDLKGLGVHTSFDFDKVVRFGPDTEDVDASTLTPDYSLDNAVIAAMHPAIDKVFKNISLSDLTVDYAGIRSKIVDAQTGNPIPDFIIDSPLPGYLECLGIESPGLTASPAITNRVISLLKVS